MNNIVLDTKELKYLLGDDYQDKIMRCKLTFLNRSQFKIGSIVSLSNSEQECEIETLEENYLTKLKGLNGLYALDHLKFIRNKD